jgi:hypothetical protein
MWAPVLIGGGVLAYVFHKQKAGDAVTANETPDEAKAADANAREWLAEWKTPNEWDRRYPAAPAEKPLPVKWEDFDPEFARRLRAAFDTMEAQRFDPYVFEAARTQRRQAWLYGQGRPEFKGTGRTGNKVTWTLDASKHGAYPARAADVISRTTHWGDPRFFDAWGKAAQAQGLRWLGSIGDKPHVELA